MGLFHNSRRFHGRLLPDLPFSVISKMSQIFDIALRPPDRGKCKPQHFKTDAPGKGQHPFDDFQVHLFIPDHSFFAHLLSARLELRLDERRHLGVAGQKVLHRLQHLGQRDKRHINGGKLYRFFDLLPCNQAAGMYIFVLTQPKDETQKQAYISQLLQALEDSRKQQMPTILIDASNGTYGTAVYDALTKQAELGYLLAYSGMLDMAIVTGTALSHGVARYAVLRNEDNTDAMDRAWARSIADSILKDFCYKGVVRNGLLAYIRNDLGGDANNFWSPELDREDLLQRLEEGMEQETAPVIRNLERSAFLSSISPDAKAGERHWGGIALENYRFPWDRAFEIGMDIRLGEFQ